MSSEYGGSSASGKSSSSTGGFLFGIVLFLASFPVLFYNEGNAVNMARALDEGKGAVVSLADPIPNPAQEDNLVHFTGTAVTDDVMTDGYTGLTMRAIKLHRIAEMYQWQETTRKKEERTEYYYDKVWSQAQLNSSNYHNQSYSNPSTMRVVSEWYKAEDVFVGEFKLSSTLISAIGNSQSYPVTEDMYEQFSDSLRSEALLYSGVLYLGSSPQNPIIGDIKVSYQVYPEQEVSVVAMQQNGRAVGFTTTNGRVLEILYSGFKTADQIFATEQTKNVILTWVIRGAGIMLMYVGLMLSVGQLARLFSWIPLLGAAVASGIALMAGLLSISLSFIVISVAWIFYRPTLGIGLLLVAGFLVFVLIKKAQWMDDDDEISTEPPPPPPLPVP